MSESSEVNSVCLKNNKKELFGWSTDRVPVDVYGKGQTLREDGLEMYRVRK